ncbi:MAG: 3-hydroxyacyl-CoA dehydrogenase NAD-binding domain-containing protein, partial [Gammaproteobacteria bacterium]
MRVVIIGTGYVGLVSGTCFAEFGADVTCVDLDTDKVERLNKGEIPIYEPGLDNLVASNAKFGRLSFTTDLSSVAGEADLIFIAVVRRCTHARLHLQNAERVPSDRVSPTRTSLARACAAGL